VDLGKDLYNEAVSLPSWSWASVPGGIWYGSPRKVYTLQVTHSQISSDIKIFGFTRGTHQESSLHCGSKVSLEVEGLLQEIQLNRLYDSHYIVGGVKLPPRVRWSVIFGKEPAPYTESSGPSRYLLRIVGCSDELFDLYYPINVSHRDNPAVNVDSAVVSRLW
jgi:hypothetical protein